MRGSSGAKAAEEAGVKLGHVLFALVSLKLQALNGLWRWRTCEAWHCERQERPLVQV